MTPQPGPTPRSPFNDPDARVAVRLEGPRDAVALLIAVLEKVSTVTDVTGPLATKTPGTVRVHLRARRRTPITGGAK